MGADTGQSRAGCGQALCGHPTPGLSSTDPFLPPLSSGQGSTDGKQTQFPNTDLGVPEP